jgi:hypothetical protein
MCRARTDLPIRVPVSALPAEQAMGARFDGNLCR